MKQKDVWPVPFLANMEPGTFLGIALVAFILFNIVMWIVS